jgi:hypothetical protein
MAIYTVDVAIAHTMLLDAIRVEDIIQESYLYCSVAAELTRCNKRVALLTRSDYC